MLGVLCSARHSDARGWHVAHMSFVGPFEGPRPAGWHLVCYRPASLVVRRQTLGTEVFEDRPGTWSVADPFEVCGAATFGTPARPPTGPLKLCGTAISVNVTGQARVCIASLG